MTAAELRLTLLSAGIAPPATLIGDAAYKPPRADWLTGEFDEWFRAALKALGLEHWAAENWDCDDFADLYSVLARVCHRRTAGSAGTGLPVGVLWFQQRRTGGHAINIAVTSDQGVVFPEPQHRRTLLMLRPEERQSAWLAKL